MPLLEHLEVVDRVHVHVRCDRHLLCRGSRTPRIVVEEGLGQREGTLLVEGQVARVGHPVAVLRLVVHEQAEGFFGIAPLLEPLDAPVRDQVGQVAVHTHRIARLADEIGVVVVALSGNDLPMVETRRQTSQVPLADDGRLVAGLLQQFGEGLLRSVEGRAERVVRIAVGVRMFAREHAGAARAAQRIGHEAVGEADAPRRRCGRGSGSRHSGGHSSSSSGPYGRRS